MQIEMTSCKERDCRDKKEGNHKREGAFVHVLLLVSVARNNEIAGASASRFIFRLPRRFGSEEKRTAKASELRLVQMRNSKSRGDSITDGSGLSLVEIEFARRQGRSREKRSEIADGTNED
jgi:hypothetical protein